MLASLQILMIATTLMLLHHFHYIIQKRRFVLLGIFLLGD